MKLLLLGCILLLIQFSTAQQITTKQRFNNTAFSTAQCDLNGDGVTDLVHGSNGGIYFYFQSVPFGAAPSFTYGGFSNLTNSTSAGSVTSLVCKDVDGDGYADIVAACPTGYGIVGFYKGSINGPPSYPTRSWQGATSSAGMGISLNLGRIWGINASPMDLVVGNSRGLTGVQIFAGSVINAVFPTTATATLTYASDTLNAFGTQANGITIFDLNADGYDDLLVASPGSASVVIYAGTATGISTTPSIAYSPGSGLWGYVAAYRSGSYSYVVLGISMSASTNVYANSRMPTGGSVTSCCTSFSSASMGTSVNTKGVMALGDITGDGLPEWSYWIDFGGTTGIQVYSQQGTGGLAFGSAISNLIGSVDEFYLLTAPQNNSLSANCITSGISNFTFSATSSSILEGDVGTQTINIAVQRSGYCSSTTYTLTFAFSGTATINDDYSVSTTSLTFTQFVVKNYFTVTVYGDTNSEWNETVVISASLTGGVANNTHTLTIVADDPLPSPSVTPSISVSPSVTPTASVTPSQSATPSVTPSNSRTPSISVSPSKTPSRSPSSSPSSSKSPSRTSSPSPSVTPSMTPTSSVTPSETPSVSPTPSVTPSPSITPTPSVSATPSTTPTPSVSPTPSVTPSPSITPTPSVSASPSITPTPSVSPSPSITPTPSVSSSPSITPTPSVSPSPSITPTPSISATPSMTPSATTSPSVTPSNSRTPTPSASATPSVTPSVSAAPSPSISPGVPAVKPAVPENARVVIKGAKTVKIDWDEPQSDGRSPILSYVLQYASNSSFNNATTVEFFVNSTFAYTASVGGLVTGRTYYFRIAAKNIIGMGNWSLTNPSSVTPVAVETKAQAFQVGVLKYTNVVEGLISNQNGGNGQTTFTSTTDLFTLTNQGYESRYLLKFDNLTGLLPNDSIPIQAFLQLTFSNNGGPFSIDGFYLSSLWTEANLGWMYRSGFNQWSTDGALSDTVVDSTFNIQEDAQGIVVKEVELDPLVVQQWINGSNYGLLLVMESENSAVDLYNSKHATRPGFRPLLRIMYQRRLKPTDPPISAPVFPRPLQLTSQPRNIIVSNTGNDISGSGTVLTPYKTIQKALQMALEGDTIQLRAGTYAGGFVISKASITLQNYPGESPVIVSPINVPSLEYVITIGTDAHNTKISDLEIVGGFKSAIYFTSTWEQFNATEAPALASAARNVLIEDCKIHDSGSDIINIQMVASEITIRRSELFDAGQRTASKGHAISALNVAGITLQDNYIHDIPESGIFLAGGTRNALVQRNLIKNCGTGISFGSVTETEKMDSVRNPSSYECIACVARNNIIANIIGPAISLTAAHQPVIYYNTIWAAAQLGGSPLVIQAALHDTAAVTLTDKVSVFNNIISKLSTSADSVMISIKQLQVSDRVYEGLNGTMYSASNIFYIAYDGVCSFEDEASSWTGNLDNWKDYIEDSSSMEVDPMLDSNYVPQRCTDEVEDGTDVASVPSSVFPTWLSNANLDDFNGDLRTTPSIIGAVATLADSLELPAVSFAPTYNKTMAVLPSYNNVDNPYPIWFRRLPQTFFVATTGSDFNIGSFVSPFATVTKALDVALPGDTIYIRNGTYTDGFVISKPNITISTFTGDAKAKIACSTSDPDVTACVTFAYGSAENSLSNLEITGGYYYAILFDRAGGAANSLYWNWYKPLVGKKPTANTQIVGCNIHHSGTHLIKILSNTDGVTIRQTEIAFSGVRTSTILDPSDADFSSSPAQGSSVFGNGIDNQGGVRIAIQDNYIHDISGACVLLAGGAFKSSLSRNMIARCSSSAVMFGSPSAKSENYDKSTNPGLYDNYLNSMSSNIIMDIPGNAISFYSCANATIVHNTFMNVGKSNQAAIFFGLSARDVDAVTQYWNPNKGILFANNIVSQESLAAGNTLEISNIRVQINNQAMFADPNATECAESEDEIPSQDAPFMENLSAVSSYFDLTMFNNIYYRKTMYGVGLPTRFVDQTPGRIFQGTLDKWRTLTSLEQGSYEGDPMLDSAYAPLNGSPAKNRTTSYLAVDDFYLRARPLKPQQDLGASMSPSGTRTFPPKPLKAVVINKCPFYIKRAQGTEIMIVDPINGIDSICLSGNETFPYRTIKFAASRALQNTTILLRSGVHTGPIEIIYPWITISSYPGERATIRSSPFTEGETIRVLPGANRQIVIQDLDIVGGYNNALFINSAEVTVTGCNIHGSGGPAVYISNTMNVNGTVLFANNNIYNAGQRQGRNGDGIRIEGAANVSLFDNTISNCRSTGIQVRKGASNIKVVRNMVVNCQRGIVLGNDNYGTGISIPGQVDTACPWYSASNPLCYDAINVMVANNIIMNTQGAGIAIKTAKNAQVVHNTLYRVAHNYEGGVLLGATYHIISSTNQPLVSNQDVTIKNNIVTLPSISDQPIVHLQGTTLGANSLNGIGINTILDHNIYYCYPSTGSALFHSSFSGTCSVKFSDDLEETVVGFYAWSASQDSSSVVENPLLNSNMVPLYGSPAIAQAAILDNSTDIVMDYFQNNRTSEDSFNIGAVESSENPENKTLPSSYTLKIATPGGMFVTDAERCQPPACWVPGWDLDSGSFSENDTWAQCLHSGSIFPENGEWSRDVSGLSVNSFSYNLINTMGSTGSIVSGFGVKLNDYQLNGMIIMYVSGSHTKGTVGFSNADESDSVSFPIPEDLRIEGGANIALGPRRLIMLDVDNCKVYELRGATKVDPEYRSWLGVDMMAETGVVFDLNSNALRNLGWASADDAGMSVIAGLVTYHQVSVMQEIKHALRFSTQITRNAYLTPAATHFKTTDTDSNNPQLPPMGLRLRLKSSYRCSSHEGEALTICNALKTYGMILADTGDNWYLSGVSDPRLEEATLDLGLAGNDFEVVDTGAKLCTILDCSNE